MLKASLSEESYRVTQEAATEAPFTNAYDQTFEEGIYVDITTGEPLFFLPDKFASGCGWPSFSHPISKELIHYYKDLSHGMERIEVRSRSGSAHLGHVFTRWTAGVRRPPLLYQFCFFYALWPRMRWKSRIWLSIAYLNK